MEIHTPSQGRIMFVPATLQTSKKGFFAGGDAVTGPWIAIEAVAAGKEAAISIDRYLRGEDLFEGRQKPKLEKARYEEIYAGQTKAPREGMELLSIEERRETFSEGKRGFNEGQAEKES